MPADVRSHDPYFEVEAAHPKPYGRVLVSYDNSGLTTSIPEALGSQPNSPGAYST